MPATLALLRLLLHVPLLLLVLPHALAGVADCCMLPALSVRFSAHRE